MGSENPIRCGQSAGKARYSTSGSSVSSMAKAASPYRWCEPRMPTRLASPARVLGDTGRDHHGSLEELIEFFGCGRIIESERKTITEHR